MESTAAPLARASARQVPSCVSSVPITQPPPW
jgi:hypothetical protein